MGQEKPCEQNAPVQNESSTHCLEVSGSSVFSVSYKMLLVTLLRRSVLSYSISRHEVDNESTP